MCYQAPRTLLWKIKCLLSDPTGQDNYRQPVTLIVAEHDLSTLGFRMKQAGRFVNP